ncbi:hypothetical protein CABS01_04748 [Colletotrichum abscissum]|uniref:Uncharacterized protein n=1 Tax=Colletotrichum lupini TaxID=145971 RepID=A0A9Q8T5R9_9PEZI|nr:uncharacterized protein CLUP02_15274 [Colletotrichum lupini]XP_060389780.1 uncharacterized protein CABS01_04748 [Colletotrichum abscissum]KAK1472105.1 hypothetical protein CABS01_04748 [Colletotrichum abscissum]UQC89743.1 hypothetical protein CLUP02_15274 [Colletotrichum lupini]
MSATADVLQSMSTPVEDDSVTDACKLESTKTKSPHLGHPLMDNSKAASQAKMFWPASSCALIRPKKFARSYANMTRYASASRTDRRVDSSWCIELGPP